MLLFLLISMLSFLFLFTFTTCVSAKCGLWYQFSHTSERDGPHRENRYSSNNPYSDTQWAMGFGYESLDQEVTCLDLEMFHQCGRAQQMLDLYTAKNLLPYQTIGCHNHIVCASPLPTGNGRYWCQNMDSYDLCLIVQNITANTDYSVTCGFSILLQDNIPVLDYRQPGILVTTTIALTIPENTTVATTTTPANGANMIINSFVVLLVLITLL